MRVNVESARDAVEIHVIDTGRGIAPQEQERWFDGFYQVHNEERDPKKGFGLGLAIARRLAWQLGGGVTVQSAAGAGSRFSLTLFGVVVPSNRRAAEPAEAAPAGAAAR